MKKTVCVIFGGRSSEHEVSCSSAANVLSYIDKELYEVITVGITKEGNWRLYNGGLDEIRNRTWESAEFKKCILSPDPRHHGLLVFNKNGDVSVTHIDIIFPVLHGKNGEDGTIEGLFELAGVPYVGCGVLASSACMDKITTKIILKNAGIPVCDGFDICAHEAEDACAVNKKITDTVGYPVVIKPSNAGSSVGITLVKSESELAPALKLAVENDRRILIERAMNIRELECAVMGSYEKAEASCVGEIVKKTEMYDYETKYITDSTELVMPADISDGISDKIRQMAIKAFSALDCFGLSRIDFFMDKDTGEILLNEINTLPGFTNISMYPKLWEKSGVSNKELITKLLELAEKRYN
ncbi:MAG: D-alanine--D-alanine ligase [Clostridia bacterium]|nr:D-alanine--D-alanine ligase [Clostridia bacterium]